MASVLGGFATLGRAPVGVHSRPMQTPDLRHGLRPQIFLTLEPPLWSGWVESADR